MKKVLAFSVLLLLAMIVKQLLPSLLGEWFHYFTELTAFVCAVLLSYIMINVGREFDIDKENPKKYAKDAAISSLQATVPWLVASVFLYVVFVILLPLLSLLFGSESLTLGIQTLDWASLGAGFQNWGAWIICLLVGRFAAPTSAGLLFPMLKSSGLKEDSWVLTKAQTLAIFDDLDTVLLMVLLTMLMAGFSWQLVATGIVMLGLLGLAWILYGAIDTAKWPLGWRRLLLFSFVIAVASETIHVVSGVFDPSSPIHFEVLLPAFVLGCMFRPKTKKGDAGETQTALHADERAATNADNRAATIVSGVFMVVVGLSMPVLHSQNVNVAAETTARALTDVEHQSAVDAAAAMLNLQHLSFGSLVALAVVLTVLINAGKFVPRCFYHDIDKRERLALCVGMWPRGEVGAGVLVAAMKYGIDGPIVIVAVLCLAINLLLTYPIIVLVVKLVKFPKASIAQCLSLAAAQVAADISEVLIDVVQWTCELAPKALAFLRVRSFAGYSNKSAILSQITVLVDLPRRGYRAVQSNFMFLTRSAWVASAATGAIIVSLAIALATMQLVHQNDIDAPGPETSIESTSSHPTKDASPPTLLALNIDRVDSDDFYLFKGARPWLQLLIHWI